jgi:hypothetical protein
MKTIFLENLIENVNTQQSIDDKVKVYVVVTDTKTIASKVISLKTNSSYNHVSLTFDPGLKKMYSFNVYGNGLVEESHDHFSKETIAAVYSLAVSKDIAESMRKRIEEIKEKRMTFNLKGIVGLLFDTPISDKTAMFCSEFVANIFHDCGIQLFHKPLASVKPSDFVRVKKLKFEKRGKLIDIKL